jgi:hypothetical protein
MHEFNLLACQSKKELIHHSTESQASKILGGTQQAYKKGIENQL